MESVLALALTALIILSTGWFQRSLERRVIAALESLTGGRVEIAGFHFRPWVLQATLQNLVIHGSEAAGEPPLVSARQVVAHLSPQAFFRQHLQLRGLDVDVLRLVSTANRKSSPHALEFLRGSGGENLSVSIVADGGDDYCSAWLGPISGRPPML